MEGTIRRQAKTAQQGFEYAKYDDMRLTVGKRREFLSFLWMEKGVLAALVYCVAETKFGLVFEDVMRALVKDEDPEEVKILMAFCLVELERGLAGTMMRGNTLTLRIMSSAVSRMMHKVLTHPVVLAFLRVVDSLPSVLNADVPAERAKIESLALQLILALGHPQVVNACPLTCRQFFAFFGKQVEERFPDQKAALLGGLVFLRTLCPALVVPAKLMGVPNVSPTMQKNVMQVVRLVQNASNQQLFKEGANVVFNTWLTENFGEVKSYLDKLANVPIPELPVVEAQDPLAGKEVDDKLIVKLVQLAATYRPRVVLESEEQETRFLNLLRACGDPFANAGGSKQGVVLSAAPGQKLLTRAQMEVEWLAKYPIAMPSDFLTSFFTVDHQGMKLEKLVTICSMCSHVEFGVPQAKKMAEVDQPGVSPKSMMVFVARDLIDWLMDHLNLTDRITQGLSIVQDLVDHELILPWELFPQEEQRGAVIEVDGDRLLSFDLPQLHSYRMLFEQSSASSSSSGLPSSVAKEIRSRADSAVDIASEKRKSRNHGGSGENSAGSTSPRSLDSVPMSPTVGSAPVLVGGHRGPARDRAGTGGGTTPISSRKADPAVSDALLSPSRDRAGSSPGTPTFGAMRKGTSSVPSSGSSIRSQSLDDSADVVARRPSLTAAQSTDTIASGGGWRAASVAGRGHQRRPTAPTTITPPVKKSEGFTMRFSGAAVNIGSDEEEEESPRKK